MNGKFSRIPIVPLDLKQSYKAVPNELLVDRANGNIYIKKMDGELFDVTQSIREAVEKFNSDNIYVTIDGIKYTLTETIVKFLNETLQLKETGEEAKYIVKQDRIDDMSIEAKFKRVQIRNFDQAENGALPQKHNGVIRWVKLPDNLNELLQEADEGSPDDGIKTKIRMIEPLNAKVYLQAARNQKTPNLHENVRVILPSILDEFSEVYWMARTYAYKPTLIFPSNVYFNTAFQPMADSQNLYIFRTFDGGETWLGELRSYNNTTGGATDATGAVTLNYLKDNYSTSLDNDAKYLTKENASKKYYNKEEIRGTYMTSREMLNKYYDKDQINDILENKYELKDPSIDKQTALIIDTDGGDI